MNREIMKKVTLFEREDYVEHELPKIFNRTKDEVEKDVKMLQEWMKTQPHLPEIMDFLPLRQIFINNKCSIEVTKKKVDMYYTIRSKMPDVSENINPKLSPIKRILYNKNLAILAVLPKLASGMNRIFIMKILNKEIIDYQDFQSYCYLSLPSAEFLLRESYHFKHIFIYDLSNVTLENVKIYSPITLLKIIMINECTIKWRVEAIYFINASAFANILFNIFKKILKPKLFQKFHFCDEEFIRNQFPKEILPKDYDGGEKSLEELHDLARMKLYEYQDRFDKLDNMKVDESLRPEKLENDDFLGYYGSFKKLQLD